MFDAAPNDRPHHALEVHALGIGRDLLHHEAIGRQGRRLATHVHHAFTQAEADIDLGDIHVLDQLFGHGRRPLGILSGEVSIRPGPHHAIHAIPPARHSGVIAELLHGLRIHEVAFGQRYEMIIFGHSFFLSQWVRMRN